MKLDHIVVHIDNNPAILTALKQQTDAQDIPFEPDWGKGTRGFKAANIWIGRQYFEIVRLLRPDGGGWPAPWVTRYNAGTRGLNCLYFSVEDIEATADMLTQTGIANDGPERLSFSLFFGLWTKVLPWRLIYLPPVPGTDFEIGFIQYDADPKDRMKRLMVPNADEHGVSGIASAMLEMPLSGLSMKFLKRVFPSGIEQNGEYKVALEQGNIRFVKQANTALHLYAQGRTKRGMISIGNVTLHL